MVTIVRYPKDAQVDDSSSNEATSATAAIVTGPDGVEQRYPNPPPHHGFSGNVRAAGQGAHIDSGTALQIGMYRLLFGLESHRIDVKDLIEDEGLKSDSFRLERILFDWPRPEDEIDPMPTALLHFPDEQELQNPHLNALILDDTVDAFGEGTVLKWLGSVSTTMLVVIWSAGKEERRALRAALETTLIDEGTDERLSRRVAVREYYDRTARFTFMGISYGDNEESAQRKQWIMTARFDCEIDVVKLVTAPAYMTPFIRGPAVGTDIEP